MTEKPITIAYSQTVEWGPERAELIQGLIKQVMEEKTGQEMAWMYEINRDAITLRPVAEEKRPEPESWARIDLWQGTVTAQYLPGQRDRLLRELLILVDSLKADAAVPFVQVAEVSAVKQ